MLNSKPRRDQEKVGKKRRVTTSARQVASRYRSFSHQEFDFSLEFYINSKMRRKMPIGCIPPFQSTWSSASAAARPTCS